MKRSMSLLVTVAVGAFIIGCTQHQSNTQEKPAGITPAIETDCIVHYYKSNASAYITRQQHGYNPSAGFFQAVSTEPVGTIRCSLLKDDFNSTGPKQQTLSALPADFWNRNLAAMVFYSFCAGGGLLDAASMPAAENVRVQGRWYTPLKAQWPGGMSVTLLRSLDTKRIEMVRMDDASQGLSWLANSYNMRYSKELSSRLPRTIDVFDIRDGVASKDLMVRFDYKDIWKAP